MRESSRRHADTSFLVVGLLVLLAGSPGCDSTPPPAQSPPAQPSAPVANVVRPTRAALRRVVEQPGYIQAYEETQVFARVPGYVGRVNADIGQTIRGPRRERTATGTAVTPGDVLAELAVPELVEESKQKQAMVRQAEAELEQVRRSLIAAEASITVAQSALDEMQSAFDRWESESKRMTGLVKDRVIDAQSSEETLNQFKASGSRVASGKAAVARAKAERDRARADIHAAEAKIDVSTADAARAAVMAGYATIRAPYDGIVTARRVNTGDFVQPMGGHGDWLFRVARLDPVRVVVAVPEADAALVEEKSEASLLIHSVPGPVVQAPVTRTSWALEPGSRTLRAEIDLPNKDGKLRPGMYVSARLSTTLPEAWVLPSSAVVRQGDVTVCFLITDGVARRTPVQVGRSDGQFVEVLRRHTASPSPGWETFGGTEVVALRAANLTDGQAFKAVESSAAQPTAAQPTAAKP